MSPGICATDEKLCKFPPSRIIICGIDPLKDDGLHFAHRLIENGVDTKLYEFKLMPHGFLLYDFPLGKGLV